MRVLSSAGLITDGTYEGMTFMDLGNDTDA